MHARVVCCCDDTATDVISFYTPSTMSHLWHFSSFDNTKLDSLSESVVADALLWDEDVFADIAAVQRLARHIGTSGFSYSGLSPADAELLDELIPILFSPDGLESELNVESESNDGLAPAIVQEMFGHLPSAVYLPWLIHGRREASASSDVACNYVIIAPDQLNTLLAECSAVMAARPMWTEDYVPDVIRECLIAALKSIQAKGHHAIGVLG